MKFRTEISMEASPHLMEYGKPILMMGSCFTENIGSRLRDSLFHVQVNPFGVTYNPLSMYNNIMALMEKDSYKEDDLGFFNELWYSFDHYTLFSGTDKTAVIESINSAFLKAKKQLKQASHLILTFGTSYIYEYKENGRVVNNCHKIPARDFNRRMLSVKEITDQYIDLIQALTAFNPELKIDFTVSPVRHIKDGLHENQLSKASLLLAINELLNTFPNSCTYFPAYEMVIDDLRDYRYYTSDLLHPNEQAIDFIWGKFKEYRLDPQALTILKEVEPLVRAKKHRLLHPNSKESQEFLKNTEKKKRNLENKYPFLNWEFMQ